MKKFLTPLESYDYRTLIGRGTRRWREFCFWAMVLAFWLRLFVPLPDVFWNRVGYWCVLLGAYIAFISTPYIVFNLVSRRVQDGTIHFEIVLPFHKGSLFQSKLKTITYVVLIWTGPLFLIGWISDPAFSFTRDYLAAAFFQSNLTAPPGIVLLALAVGWFGGLWILSTLLLIRHAGSGPMLIELMGKHVFLLLMILVAVAVMLNGPLEAAHGEPIPGFLYLALVVEALLLGTTVLVVGSTARRFATLS